MTSSNLIKQYHQLTAVLDNYHPIDWDDIVKLLDKLKNEKKSSIIPPGEDAVKIFSKGTAFVTFSYGIDGVSIEISKYAHTLVDLFEPYGKPAIHLIGGNFQAHVSSIFATDWHRAQIDGIDGWDKWDDGKWFQALFKAKMKSHKKESNLLTKEIYSQAVSIAKHLGKYCVDHQISLLIPVNVASNPGNIALTLGLVLVSEMLGLYVLNSNHDFYWEAGKPLSERAPGEKPGVRDHFFRNISNRTFFSLFKLLYPWNGNRWLQLNINTRQSRELVNKFGFPDHKVFEISTCIADTFFEDYDKEDITNIRLRMGHILSNGDKIMRPVPIAEHVARIDQWMENQQPVIIGPRTKLTVDPTSDDLLILLQPTRVVGRKRIPRNLDLLKALFQKSALRDEFINNPNRQLILHITGPTPKEHQKDLEDVLASYKKLIGELPEILAERIFLAFSVGHENHASFQNIQFSPLTIESIYRMADVVVFPSETEGRGLPILEASASGIPIICSHYHPKKVFRDVIGENLPPELRIKYILFPEGKFKRAFLNRVSNLLLYPDKNHFLITHNKAAIRTRYGRDSFNAKFEQLLKHVSTLK
jgi:glycosyltransferase involved in cell wall biosynthesis